MPKFFHVINEFKPTSRVAEWQLKLVNQEQKRLTTKRPKECMEHSPSLKANNSETSTENQKVHYRVNNNHPLIPFLCLISSVHASFIS
jgi:hypothetical protein